MEVSPAKPLEVISDSEGEEENLPPSGLLDRPQYDPNEGILPVSRDQFPSHTTATMSSHNPSSHISQFPTMQLAPLVDSSIQSGSGLPATTPRPRPRPRMRPVPPPDDPDTSIGSFPTAPTTFALPKDTMSSLGNSAVQDVPAAHPPSLPPSSLPMADSSFSMAHPALSTASAVREGSSSKSKSKADHPPNEIINPSPSHAIAPSAAPSEPPLQTASKRPRPKMRPPPPAEPSASTPGTNTTAPSVATTNSNSNLSTNPSTSITSNSSGGNIAGAAQRSALDEAEEYTGRGARRFKQLVKAKEDDYVDVGGPDDEVIVLIESSDAERTAKPKPKPKKRPSKKPINPSVRSETRDGQIPASSSATHPAPSNNSKRRSPQPEMSDDEFGRWDTPVAGGPALNSTHTPNAKKRKKATVEDSDEAAKSFAPLPPLPEPLQLPPSSPLSSPGRSPVAKRKEPGSEVEDGTRSIIVKKPRKSAGTMEIVLPAPGETSKKKSKAKVKAKAKSMAQDISVGPSNAQDHPYVPSTLEGTTSTSPDHPIAQPTETVPVGGEERATGVMEIGAAPGEAKPSMPEKKASKKKAKAKKGGLDAPDGNTTEGGAEKLAEATKKPPKGKGKSRPKEVEKTAGSNGSETPPVSLGTASSNTDVGATSTSSNHGAGEPGAASANPSNFNQTPAPKSSRPKPRHSTTPAPMPVAMGASGALLQSTGRKSSDRPLSETLRLTLGGTGSPAPRMGLSRRSSSKIAPLLAMRGVPPPPPPPMPKKPVRKKKGDSDDEDSEEGPEWEGLTEKQKEKKRKEKEMAAWYSD